MPLRHSSRVGCGIFRYFASRLFFFLFFFLIFFKSVRWLFSGCSVVARQLFFACPPVVRWLFVGCPGRCFFCLVISPIYYAYPAKTVVHILLLDKTVGAQFVQHPEQHGSADAKLLGPGQQSYGELSRFNLFAAGIARLPDGALQNGDHQPPVFQTPGP